jgi:hypothetical protein
MKCISFRYDTSYEVIGQRNNNWQKTPRFHGNRALNEIFSKGLGLPEMTHPTRNFMSYIPLLMCLMNRSPYWKNCFAISAQKPLWPWKVGQMRHVYYMWCIPTKYTYIGNASSHCYLRNGTCTFLTNAPWRPNLESDRAEIWHTHSGCLDTSSHQIIAL